MISLLATCVLILFNKLIANVTRFIQDKFIIDLIASYLFVPRPTLSFLWKGIFFHPMIITVHYLVRSEGTFQSWVYLLFCCVTSQMHIFVLFLLGSSNVDASKNSKNQKGKSSSKQDRTKTPLADSEVRKLDFKVSVFLHCTKLHWW